MTTGEEIQAQEENLENALVPEASVVAEPVSIRENLATALETVKAKQAEETPKTGRERDEAGKFTKEPKEKKTVSRETPEVTLPEIKMPKSFPADKAKDFAALPRPIQELLAKREDDYHKELTKHDEERNFGRQVQALANPYLPLIKAEGGEIVKAFEQYLNTAYVLRTKSPQEKGQLILKLAQEYGADLRGASQTQPQAHPALQQMQQEIAALKGQIEQEKAFKKQQEDSAIKSQIDAFAANPKNVHFEAVKAHMAALLRGGAAKDLEDAYDQAVHANPHTRSTLLQQTNVDEQRVAEKKAKAEAAKRAGSSLRGAPGIAATKNGRIVQPDLRSELKAQFAAFRDG